MTAAKRDGNAVVLSARDATFIRQTLLAAADIFAQAQAAGPGLKALQEAALDVPHGARPLSRVCYDVNLAVDYIDFPGPLRNTR